MTSHLKARSSSSGQLFKISRLLAAAKARPKCQWSLLVLNFVAGLLPLPQPKRYLSGNTFNVGQVTKRQSFMRMATQENKKVAYSMSAMWFCGWRDVDSYNSWEFWRQRNPGTELY